MTCEKLGVNQKLHPRCLKGGENENGTGKRNLYASFVTSAQTGRGIIAKLHRRWCKTDTTLHGGALRTGTLLSRARTHEKLPGILPS